MPRETFTIPRDATEPEWGFWELENTQTGLCKFKIQSEPNRMTPKRVRNTIMRVGRRYYKLGKVERISGPVESPPLRPFYVYGKLIGIDPL